MPEQHTSEREDRVASLFVCNSNGGVYEWVPPTKAMLLRMIWPPPEQSVCHDC